MEQSLSELSGGELQKVMIAKCLSDDSDIILMDEPSAYLDVEQRLEISKVIREVMEQKGKSALIEGLLFLFGKKTRNSLLLDETKNGLVEAIFDLERKPNLINFLNDHDQLLINSQKLTVLKI